VAEIKEINNMFAANKEKQSGEEILSGETTENTNIINEAEIKDAKITELPNIVPPVE